MSDAVTKRRDDRAKSSMCPIMQTTCVSENCKFWGNKDCIFLEQLTEMPNLIIKPAFDDEEEEEEENDYGEDDNKTEFYGDSEEEELEILGWEDVEEDEYSEDDIKEEDDYDEVDERDYEEEDGVEKGDEYAWMKDERVIEYFANNSDCKQESRGYSKHDYYTQEELAPEIWDTTYTQTDDEGDPPLPIKSMEEIVELLGKMDPFPVNEWEGNIPEFFEKPENEIVDSLVNYCIQKKPDEVDWDEFRYVRAMFWEIHGIKPYLLPADYRMRIDEIEQHASKNLIESKIPDVFKKMSVKELTEKILNDTPEDNKWLMVKIRGEFSINGVLERYLPEELQEKIEIARKCAVELIDEDIEEEMRKSAKKLIPKFLRWCKSKNLKNITKLCVDAFMFDIGKDYPEDARAYIQFVAQLKFND